MNNVFIDAAVAELELPPAPKAASHIEETYAQYSNTSTTIRAPARSRATS